MADFIKWYIDQDTGYAIEERGGVVRWFIILNDEPIWADEPNELFNKYGIEPKSLMAFIRPAFTIIKYCLITIRIYPGEFKSAGRGYKRATVKWQLEDKTSGRLILQT